MEKLNTLAQAVGAKFTIEEVDDFSSIQEKEILKMIAAHMDQQGGGWESLPYPWLTSWA